VQQQLAPALFAGAASFVLGLAVASAQTGDVTPELAKVIVWCETRGKLQIRSTTSVNGAAEGAKIAQAGIKRMFGGSTSPSRGAGPRLRTTGGGPLPGKAGWPTASSDVFMATADQITPISERGLYRAGQLGTADAGAVQV